MSRTATVKDWATDLDHLDPQLGRRPVSDLGRVAAEVPDRPHRALQGRLSADALRGRARHRLRPRALLLAQGDRARSRRRPPTTARRRSPPTRRGTGWRAWCCCRPSRPRPSTSSIPKAREICNELIDGFIAKGSCDARRRLRPAHPRAGHRPHAGHSRRATATCSAAGSRPCSRTASPTTPR